MPILKEVIDYLHSIAPNRYQESYDNSGLLVGDSSAEVKGIVVSLDVTEAILDEAIGLGANVIVSHHPIIFSGLKRIIGRNYVERIVAKAIKNDINLFAIHTNLDNVYNHGVNTHIAQRLGLNDVEILKPNIAMEADTSVGAGVIGNLSKPMSEMAFLEDLKLKMNTSTIKYTDLRSKPIHRVAICGGSGRFLLDDAKAGNADIFISSDFKYHEFFDADNQIVIADIGHFESEQYTINLLFELLTEKFNNFVTHFTKVNTNPVNYL
jgi:dinuclear metal center YbgI/SA1388 family protein